MQPDLSPEDCAAIARAAAWLSPVAAHRGLGAILDKLDPPEPLPLRHPPLKPYAPRENGAPPLATTERGPSIMAGDQNTGSRGLTTPDGRTYLKKLPASITADQVLVHNAVPPTRVLGPRGFRVWTQPTTHPLAVEECGCGWAPELGVHYRVIGVPWRG